MYATRIHRRIVINAVLGMTGQSFLVEEIPLGKKDLVLSLLILCSSPGPETPFFWMFCNFFLFILSSSEPVAHCGLITSQGT